MAVATTSYVNDLNRLVRRPSIELERLTKVWPAAVKQFLDDRSRLLDAIPREDPIRFTVDLLQSIKCAADETLHTQALAYALDPSQGHGFGKSVLTSLLETIRRIHPRAGAAAVLQRVRKQNVTLRVTPEYRFRIEGIRNRSIARSDIWIEATMRKSAALIVIENKIGAGESEGQLSWYERKARAWCKNNGACHLLIFLTMKGGKANTAKTRYWVGLSYLELAAALRSAWRYNRKTAGAEWLALYIASITRGLLGMDIEGLEGVSLKDIKTYLGRAN